MEKDNKLNERISNELKNEAKGLNTNESIRLAALNSLRAKHEKKRILPLFISYKVPAWMAAAAILLILFLLPSVFKVDINELGNNQQFAVADTVYIDRVMTDTIEVIKTSAPIVRTVYVNEKNTQEIDELNVAKSLKRKELEGLITMKEYQFNVDLSVRTSGKSLSDDPLAKSVLNISN